MKRTAFTLAEVLITLGIIGVIAALTIPTFVSDSEKKSNAAKISATINTLENTFVSMITSEGVQELVETEFAQNPTMDVLSKYIKISKSTDKITDYYSSASAFKTIDGRTVGAPDYDTIFQTKNGALVFYKAAEDDELYHDVITVKDLGGTVNEGVAYLSIDVNGAAKPNLWGRDTFDFIVGNDGMLYPCGSLNYSILRYENADNVWTNPRGSMPCSVTVKSKGCSARLIENNFKIDF